MHEKIWKGKQKTDQAAAGPCRGDSFFWHKWFQGPDQIWQIVVDRIPNSHVVDTKVFMDKPVSNANDLMPWDIRMILTKFFGNMACRFTHDLERIHYSILNEFIRFKLL
jgi:hypothetical protein